MPISSSTDGPAERILARTKEMCRGYSRVYMAWVNTPAEDREGRKKALGVVMDHLLVCGCAHEGQASSEWIFVDEEER